MRTRKMAISGLFWVKSMYRADPTHSKWKPERSTHSESSTTTAPPADLSWLGTTSDPHKWQAEHQVTQQRGTVSSE